jgi:hypothetical protein
VLSWLFYFPLIIAWMKDGTKKVFGNKLNFETDETEKESF